MGHFQRAHQRRAAFPSFQTTHEGLHSAANTRGFIQFVYFLKATAIRITLLSGICVQHIVFESYLSVFAMPWDYISHGALPLTVLLLAQAEKVFLGRRTTVVINS